LTESVSSSTSKRQAVQGSRGLTRFGQKEKDTLSPSGGHSGDNVSFRL
jgi:hypothetical protein